MEAHDLHNQMTDSQVSQDFYEVRTSEEFGRYLIAYQDIEERTLILQESPVIHAPADESDSDHETSSLTFCLECCVHLKTFGEDDKCPNCGWPLCTKLCKENHLHKENECKVFQLSAAKFPPPHGWPILYKSVLILRILILIREKNPDIWNRFFVHLEHHTEVRNKKERCVKADGMILENLQYFVQGAKGLLDLDEKFVKQIIGIVNVNAFGASKGNDDRENLRKFKSLFEKASLFAHSCAPNCTWKIPIDSSQNWTPQIKVYTSIPIKKGELLTIPYNTRHLFYGTLKRQLLIESVAHFTCKCIRCQDSTELQTFMSSLHCFQCEKGLLVSKNPEIQESDWICSNAECLAVETVSKIVYFVTDVENYFDKIQNAHLGLDKELVMLEKLFKKHYGILLHKNHYTLQEISTRILELLVESLGEASSEQVDIFLWHCEYLKRIANVILPGYNGYQDQLLDYSAEGYYHKKRLLGLSDSDN